MIQNAGRTRPLASEDDRPDLERVVVEAVHIAARRGLPMVAGLRAATAGGTVDSEEEPSTLAAASPSPLSSPTTPAHIWMQLPPETVEKARHVDINRSLADLAPRMAEVEAEIERLITPPVKLIADVAAHTLGAGGKRLRPALTLLAAQLCGAGAQAGERVLTCAAAVELTHTTTLLHDDVVDEASTRRGRPTANQIWGNQTSVLVGDYLFAQVFAAAAQKGLMGLMQPLAMATAQMCAGELLETQTRGYLEMQEAQYRDIIALKTASLTDCACRMGALAMEAPDDDIERLSRFGRDIGMAFQIVDDVLDVTSNARHVGKPVGQDIREGDVTLPLLRALEIGSSEEAQELRELAGNLPISDEEIERALEIIRGTDAVAYSMQAAAEYVASAKEQLAAFPESAARSMLHAIADFVMSRER